MGGIMAPQTVLFICIHNSARSQMAEAYLNAMAAGRYTAQSAGIEPGSINPLVIQALLEDGIDIRKKETQSVASLIAAGKRFDYVVTVSRRCCRRAVPVCSRCTCTSLHCRFPYPSFI
jgi:arsenate reductase